MKIGDTLTVQKISVPGVDEPVEVVGEVVDIVTGGSPAVRYAEVAYSVPGSGERKTKRIELGLRKDLEDAPPGDSWLEAQRLAEDAEISEAAATAVLRGEATVDEEGNVEAAGEDVGTVDLPTDGSIVDTAPGEAVAMTVPGTDGEEYPAEADENGDGVVDPDEAKRYIQRAKKKKRDDDPEEV